MGDQDVEVSTHSRLKAAGIVVPISAMPSAVSTHSRLKAAGSRESSKYVRVYGFNTQPPEGGWSNSC